MSDEYFEKIKKAVLPIASKYFGRWFRRAAVLQVKLWSMKCVKPKRKLKRRKLI